MQNIVINYSAITFAKIGLIGHKIGIICDNFQKNINIQQIVDFLSFRSKMNRTFDSCG